MSILDFSFGSLSMNQSFRKKDKKHIYQENVPILIPQVCLSLLFSELPRGSSPAIYSRQAGLIMPSPYIEPWWRLKLLNNQPVDMAQTFQCSMCNCSWCLWSLPLLSNHCSIDEVSQSYSIPYVSFQKYYLLMKSGNHQPNYSGSIYQGLEGR